MKFYTYNIQELSNEDYQKYFLMMSPQKQQRVKKLRFEDDKKRTVAGEMLARKAIAKFCYINESAIVFHLNEHGKPFLKGLPCHFNISHSGDLVVLAVNNEPIGIDVEKVRSVDLAVSTRVFTTNEAEQIFSSKKPYETFFMLWTEKEAILKCIGTGFSHNKNYTKSDFETIQFKIQEYFISIATKK